MTDDSYPETAGTTSPDDFDDYDDTDCGNCGGEGFVYGCSWDWQCDTWDGDSCLCTRPCDWCNPTKPTKDSAELRKILGDALSKQTPTNGVK